MTPLPLITSAENGKGCGIRTKGKDSK